MTNDPTSQAPFNPPAADTASVGEPARRPRLLVVDDQPINIQVLYQAFSSDHQIFMATSGEQALTLCAAKQPDLVLLDGCPARGALGMAGDVVGSGVLLNIAWS